MKVELPEKRYYSIGEVAEAFDVNPSLIRYWETEFSILNPKKNLFFIYYPLISIIYYNDKI